MSTGTDWLAHTGNLSNTPGEIPDLSHCTDLSLECPALLASRQAAGATVEDHLRQRKERGRATLAGELAEWAEAAAS